MAISISFFSNFFNEHQLPVAHELNLRSNIDYSFVAMEQVDGLEGRSCLNDQYPFVIRQYRGANEASKAMERVLNDDIVVFGDMAGDESYVRERAKTGKPFFRYAERLLKRGDWWAYAPPKQYRTYDRFMRYAGSPMYVLCASGYTARDLSKFGFPVDKCLKWGYFPQVISNLELEDDQLNEKGLKLCSVQRLISWKRVDLQILMARKLRDRGLSFSLKIAGDGGERLSLERLVRRLSLEDCVELIGSISSAGASSLMSASDIFLATSNRKEGWGATVNEAMASGCAVVASNMMGSAPFLINPGVDGVVFRYGDASDLAESVESLAENRLKLKSIADAAIAKIAGPWSAGSAVDRFIRVSTEYLRQGYLTPYDDGPLSSAVAIDEDWYLG